MLKFLGEKWNRSEFKDETAQYLPKEREEIFEMRS